MLKNGNSPGYAYIFKTDSSLYLLAQLAFFLFLAQYAKAQSTSNEGTEFYAVFPSHVPATLRGPNGLPYNPPADYSIFITGSQSSSGVVTVGNFVQRFNVNANAITEIRISRNEAYIPHADANMILNNKAIHVKVDAGKPKVVVYGHIFAGARSAASLILPVEAMGQRYFSMNYASKTALDGGHNYIALIATEDNTKIYLKRNGTDLVSGGIFLNSAGDVYEYLTLEDLTGTEIVVDQVTSACKRFAVFSGTTNSVVETPSCYFTTSSSDPLYQQNYPVESWGNSYGFIPFSSQSSYGTRVRANGTYYRVLAKDNGTEVRMNGTLITTLNSGQYYQPAYPSTTPGLITSNKPVAVAQYALTQDCAGDGVSDPDMVILNPVEYNIKSITLYSSTREAIEEQYINIFMKTSAVSSFRINGSALPAAFRPLPSAPEYSYLQLNLNRYPSNNFNLSAQEGFNAVAYGFGDHESYGYSAGTNLAASQSIAAVRVDTEEELPNACTQEDFKFKLVLPDIASQLSWQFDQTETPLIQTILSPRALTLNGKTVYEYFYPRTMLFNTAGQRDIKIIANYLSSNPCYTSEQQINFVFDVYDPPAALFEVNTESCLSDSIVLINKSRSPLAEKPLVGWYWDLGNGEISLEENPQYKYPQTGNYTIKLVVDNGTGCLSNVYEKNIAINPLPVCSFVKSSASCTSNTVTFSEQSSSPAGLVSKWIWDFGDSSTEELNTGGTVSHTFPGPGSYTVKLKVLNSFGCESAVYSESVSVIAPILDAGPDRVILRGGQTPLTIRAEGNNLRYKWTPATGLNRDDVKSPLASPLDETTYTVTITSEEGCILSDMLTVSIVDEITIPNTFTPNGDGMNDVWTLQYLDTYPKSNVTIFTRYGNIVYSSIGYPAPWDGRYNGEILATGTYYYVIDPKNGKKPYSGFVTLIR